MPVGYEKIVDMYPLDFEEFLWANGISDNIIDEIRKHFNEETPVPDGLHVPLNDLFRKYAVVGGMPEAVNTFLETNNISDVYEVQQNIIEEPTFLPRWAENFTSSVRIQVWKLTF